jgi:hypothetical protein
MNSVFNLPAGITTTGAGFCYSLFSNCRGNAFQVNNVFKFPLLSSTEMNKNQVLQSIFGCDVQQTYARQNRTAMSIINGNPTPPPYRYPFHMPNDTAGAQRWSDWSAIPANWKQF